LVTLIRYSEVLAQRNALLKQFAFKGLADWGLMSVWDEQLHEASIIITQKRQEFVTSFNPVFAEMYHSISGGKEKPELEYLQNVGGAGLLTKLVDSRSKDLDVQYTTSGSHKDDLDFRLNGYPLKKFASQGQLKTFVTAMKLAQYDLMVRQSAKKPVLLLDEVFDRMDNDRVDRLLQVITQPPFSQVFLTHTDYGRVQGIMDSSSIEFLILQVIGNKVLPINSQELAKSKR
jgi:DNA replication and repair protein RecF